MQARGYAPTVVGPIAVKQKETVDNIEILLEPGYEATIRFVDEQGKTVDNVDLQGVIWCGNSSLLVQSWESDTDETLLVDHLAKIPYRLEAKAKGFEISRRELEFKPSETITWTLTRAKPTTGVIVDSKDKPVADAAIALAAEVQGNDIKQGVDWHAKTIALTDDQGRFSLEELTAKSTYLFFVKTPDQGRFLVRDIKPGQEDQRIQLPPELFIRGKVIGDLTQLKQNKGQPAISYSHDIKPIEHLSYSDSRLVPVEIKDGVGHFEIYDVLNTSCAISAGEKWVRFELTKPIDDLVIDLSQIPAQRRVIFKFKPTDGGPAPTGTVVLNAQGGDVHRGDQLEIEDGMIAIDAFVGGYVSCHANTMVGGSFKEQRIENLAAGEEPFVVEVPVTPAGAIIGTIVDEDGKPITQQNISVSASTVKPAPGEFEAGLIGSNTRVDPATGRFMITPVPLGGTYCARADIDKHIVLSQPIKVDTTRPTVTVELKKAKGIDTQVQVVDPSGKPIAGIPVHFGYGVYRNSYSYSDILTDETGSMWFRNLNPDSRISYFVSIPSKQTYCALSQVPLQLGKPNRIQLQPGLTLTGRVIDQDGQPIAEAKVHAYEPNSYVGYEAEAPTDEQGRFQLSNLPSGTFRIGANVPDSWWKRYKSFGYSESIKATAGQSEEVVVKLKGEPK
ncbi:MAG: carboxypeptidase-like regulatory domain-containing protein [Phycisphaerae bacterium]|nr:carboxypeptidase-like regulatory domain-containing protein [Phycisphaerae bacterium]